MATNALAQTLQDSRPSHEPSGLITASIVPTRARSPMRRGWPNDRRDDINPNGILPAGSLQQNFPHQNRVRVLDAHAKETVGPASSNPSSMASITACQWDGRSCASIVGLLGIPNLCV